MKLIIVESPTKSRTLRNFLGKDFKIAATLGHIRDLPKRKFGVDIKNGFEPKYVIIPGKKEIIENLKKLKKGAKLTVLALDPDREGESIAWHVKNILKLKEKDYQRIVFHEITKEAVEKALKNPRNIDMNLVNAQQARRILDRIVGYKLSPFLWRKIARGLSAGRVQSVALRLIVEREREIENFVPKEYWTIEALLKKIRNSKFEIRNKSQIPNSKSQTEFKAVLIKKEGKVIPKLGIKTKEEADKIVKDLENAEYKVINVERKEAKRNPLPPFTTSTLQQESWQKFKFPAKLTMQISQQLYEKGVITYHRSDSLNISDFALDAARKFIIQNFGQNYYQLRKFKTKSKVAQEAHEAIRPTNVEKTPKKLENFLEKNQLKIYDLIWRRFVACQMAEARFDSTSLEIEAIPRSEIRNSKKIPSSKSQISKYTFRAIGQILKFDGFLKVYPIKYEETELPSLEVNEILRLIKLIPSQHFTQPPPRYTEASLIKTLEKYGIGRPSTYAPIVSLIQERNYVKKNEKKQFYPTEIGISINDVLVTHFPEIVDLKFTAKMEDDLDEIANGKKEWVLALEEFYNPFAKNLKEKYKEVTKKQILSKEKCPECGAPLVIRMSKFGKFYGCSNYPKCKFTKPLEEKTLGIKCPICKKGEIVEKRTKKKKIFYGCSNWPECNFALWDKPTGQICPECGSLLVETKGKQIKCSNRDCNFKKLNDF